MPSPRALRAKPPSTAKNPPVAPPETRAIRFTEQQKLFIKEWAGGESINSAAARAGYTDGAAYAYRVLVKNPYALAEYQKLKAKMEASGNMSREKFMNQLQEAFDMAKLQADPMAMVAATREVGKACGYYAPVEKKITLAGNVTLDKMNRLSDRELLELVQGTGNQIAEAVELIEHQIIDEEEAHDDAQALAGPTERFVGLPDEDEGS